MQLKNGCMAVKLLDFIGLCGEVPVSLVRMLPGYYDYNRRVVTALIREGYLKERGVSTQNRSLPELDGIGIETAPAGQSRTGAARPQSCAGSRGRTWQLEENTAAPPRRGLPADSNAAQGYLAVREPKGVRDGKVARLFQRLRADPEVWLGQQGSQIIRHFL